MHKHKQGRSIISRLSRIEGHLRSIKKMVTQERDCPELLIQIAAIRSAVDGVGRLILKDHIETCVMQSQKTGRLKKTLSDLNKALDSFIS